jgi:hypothetical protein
MTENLNSVKKHQVKKVSIHYYCLKEMYQLTIIVEAL